MQKKLIQVGFSGMNKDIINQKVGQQQAYEIKNFRLNSTLDSNSLELTTERGTMPLRLEWTDENNDSVVELSVACPCQEEVGID